MFFLDMHKEKQVTCSCLDDWMKVAEVCSFLAAFNELTKIISGVIILFD